MRFVDAGLFFNAAAGRIGRWTRLPEQFGQIWFKTFSVQFKQNVHSKVQIIAFVDSGGKFWSQHSQLGLSANIYSAPFLIYLPILGADSVSLKYFIVNEWNNLSKLMRIKSQIKSTWLSNKPAIEIERIAGIVYLNHSKVMDKRSSSEGVIEHTTEVGNLDHLKMMDLMRIKNQIQGTWLINSQLLWLRAT